MCQALGIKGGTRTDPRPYCPRPQWQLPNHVTLYLNTHGHSPELTAPPTIHMLAYLLGLKKSYVLLMGLINVTRNQLHYVTHNSAVLSTRLAPGSGYVPETNSAPEKGGEV